MWEKLTLCCRCAPSRPWYVKTFSAVSTPGLSGSCVAELRWAYSTDCWDKYHTDSQLVEERYKVYLSTLCVNEVKDSWMVSNIPSSFLELHGAASVASHQEPGLSPVLKCGWTGTPGKPVPGLVWPPPSPGCAPFDCRSSCPEVKRKRTFKKSNKLLTFHENLIISSSKLFGVVFTDPLLGQSLGEPFGDEFEDVSGLAPAAHAVQQLAVLCWRCSWVHPPEPGQDATAGNERAGWGRQVRPEEKQNETERQRERDKEERYFSPECWNCSWRHKWGHLYEGNGTFFILKNKARKFYSVHGRITDSKRHSKYRLKYLKGLEILGHDISKLGISVLLGLFVQFQGLLDTSPQDDQDLQQTGHEGHVFPQQRFSLLRSNSNLDLHELKHTVYTIWTHISTYFSIFSH